MSRIGRQSDTDKWVAIVDVVCLVNIEPPIVYRGYMIGGGQRELIAAADQWANVKLKRASEEGQLGNYLASSRLIPLKDIGSSFDFWGMEDIRLFLESCHQEEGMPSSAELAEFIEEAEASFKNSGTG